MAWRSCSVLRLPGEAALRSSMRGGRSVSHAGDRPRLPAARHTEPRASSRGVASGNRQETRIQEGGGGARPPPRIELAEAAVPRRTPTPLLEQQAPPPSPRAFGRLIRPLVFTVGFTGCSFGAAAIWQYESVKFRVQSFFDEIRADWLEKMKPQKRGDVRKEINQWWNSLSEGQRTVTGIIAANAVVFCCWKVPSLQRFMIKYFTSNPASSESHT
ncbi:presenilin-associated rhomboid-like protein, mitochondrial [Limanda limanda]|uniref:presenilin-associated rhomboid-like protein, mitochondrial n=1 Tax=Limanda limanda TaxID=27771 RepID=UPI0029C98F98|nr:presenilin-associated rhomboid-like protein, mitochondrial [Limanda limanda]